MKMRSSRTARIPRPGYGVSRSDGVGICGKVEVQAVGFTRGGSLYYQVVPLGLEVLQVRIHRGVAIGVPEVERPSKPVRSDDDATQIPILHGSHRPARLATCAHIYAGMEVMGPQFAKGSCKIYLTSNGLDSNRGLGKSREAHKTKKGDKIASHSCNGR